MPQIKRKQQGVSNWHPLEANRVKGEMAPTYIFYLDLFLFMYITFWLPGTDLRG